MFSDIYDVLGAKFVSVRDSSFGSGMKLVPVFI